MTDEQNAKRDALIPSGERRLAAHSAGWARRGLELADDLTSNLAPNPNDEILERESDQKLHRELLQNIEETWKELNPRGQQQMERAGKWERYKRVMADLIVELYHDLLENGYERNDALRSATQTYVSSDQIEVPPEFA